jgi:acyl-coenzyme A thioesterase PaaI-like protein
MESTTALATPRIRLPWSRSCFVCGEANPQGLRAEIYQVGDLIEMTFRPRRDHVGWQDVVHGGLVGTVLDELMTWAAIVDGRRAYFAVDMTVRFKAPVTPEQPCLVRARATGSRRQIVTTEAWIEDAAGTVCAGSEGRYFPIPPDQLTGLRHDFVWGEGCLDLRDVLEPRP